MGTTDKRRRAVLGALAASPVMASTAELTPPSQPAATFVLIPGTWHGGWVWAPVARWLRSAGCQAYCVTCTGLGERSHLLSPDVGLQTHVDDVVNLIEWEELERPIVVAHSFGGITLTGVADRLRDRLGRVVFYDAFVPTRDRPAWVMRDENGHWPEWWQARQAKFIDGYKMDFFAEYPMEMLVDPERYPDIAALLRRRLTPHPARQWTEPVSFANGGWETLPRTYIHCVGQEFRQSSDAMYGPAKQPGWQFLEAETSRLGMLTHTRDTAEMLLSLVSPAHAEA
ncbi:MAG: alpha/beta hydrolase [Xanthomonadales bacterium]|nr:alpha/beta hydrolase [Xanthomonadales bacterium]